MLVGGDDRMGMGRIGGLGESVGGVGVMWLDGEGELNTRET